MLPFHLKKTSPEHKSPLNYFEPKTRNGGNSVADPDLQIKEGPRPSRLWDKGGGGMGVGGPASKKNFHFGLKIRGAGPPGPSPGSTTATLSPARPFFLENSKSDPTSGLPFSKGKTMGKRLGMMPGCIEYYFLWLFPKPGPNWSGPL